MYKFKHYDSLSHIIYIYYCKAHFMIVYKNFFLKYLKLKVMVQPQRQEREQQFILDFILIYSWYWIMFWFFFKERFWKHILSLIFFGGGGGFGLILWHINHCRLFNAKSFLYIYIKYMISRHILLTFLNKPALIFFCSQLNHFSYFYQIWIILFTINHLFAPS